MPLDVRDPPTEPKIAGLYAWIARNPETGAEGIMGAVSEAGLAPLITSRHRLAVGTMRTAALAIAEQAGIIAELVLFSERQALETHAARAKEPADG